MHDFRHQIDIARCRNDFALQVQDEDLPKFDVKVRDIQEKASTALSEFLQIISNPNHEFSSQLSACDDSLSRGSDSGNHSKATAAIIYVRKYVHVQIFNMQMLLLAARYLQQFYLNSGHLVHAFS